MENFINQLTSFDYLIITIISIFFIAGMSKGFIEGLLKAGTLITSAIVAKLISNPVTNVVIEKIGLHEILSNKTKDIVFENVSVDTVYLEDIVNQVLTEYGIFGDYVRETLLNSSILKVKAQELSGNKLLEFIAENITETITPVIEYFIGIIVFVVLFFVVLTITRIIGKALSGVISNIYILGGLDTLLGGVLGFIKGNVVAIIVMYLAFIYMTTISDLPVFNLESLNSSWYFNLISSFKNIV